MVEPLVLLAAASIANKPITVGSTINLNNGSVVSQVYQPYTSGGLAMQYGGRFAVFDPTNGNLALPTSLSVQTGITNGGDFISTSPVNVIGGYAGTPLTRKALTARPTSLNLSVSYGTNAGIGNFLWNFNTNSTTFFPFTSGADRQRRFIHRPGPGKNLRRQCGFGQRRSHRLNLPGHRRSHAKHCLPSRSGHRHSWVAGHQHRPGILSGSRPGHLNNNYQHQRIHRTIWNPEWRTHRGERSHFGSGSPGLATAGNGILTSQDGTAEITFQIHLFNYTNGNTSTFWLVTNNVPGRL